MRLAAANAGDRRVSTGLPGFMDETRALPMLLSSRREELMECSTYTYSSARGASGKRTRLTCRFWRLAKRTFLPRVLSLTEEEKVRGGGALAGRLVRATYPLYERVIWPAGRER